MLQNCSITAGCNSNNPLLNTTFCLLQPAVTWATDCRIQYFVFEQYVRSKPVVWYIYLKCFVHWLYLHPSDLPIGHLRNRTQFGLLTSRSFCLFRAEIFYQASLSFGHLLNVCVELYLDFYKLWIPSVKDIWRKKTYQWLIKWLVEDVFLKECRYY